MLISLVPPSEKDWDEFSKQFFYETNKHSVMFIRNEWMGFSRTSLTNKSGL